MGFGEPRGYRGAALNNAVEEFLGWRLLGKLSMHQRWNIAAIDRIVQPALPCGSVFVRVVSKALHVLRIAREAFVLGLILRLLIFEAVGLRLGLRKPALCLRVLALR